MTQKIEADSRARIAAFLPDALRTAIIDYQKMSKMKDMKAPKDFAEQQKACKVAIAHIQLLLKLAEQLNLPDEAKDQIGQEDLAKMIEAAQAELNGDDVRGS